MHDEKMKGNKVKKRISQEIIYFLNILSLGKVLLLLLVYGSIYYHIENNSYLSDGNRIGIASGGFLIGMQLILISPLKINRDTYYFDQINFTWKENILGILKIIGICLSLASIVIINLLYYY